MLVPNASVIGFMFATPSTLSIFGMNGKNIFPQYNDDHNYIHIDSHNYGVIELTSEIILHGIVEELVVE